jgi:hypothetical protein
MKEGIPLAEVVAADLKNIGSKFSIVFP